MLTHSNEGKKDENSSSGKCLKETQKTLSLWKEFSLDLFKMRKKAEVLCQKYGMSIEEFGNYADTSSNFSTEEWEKLETHRRRTAACFEEMRKCHSHLYSESLVQKTKGKLKKVKRLFGAREGWIQG